EQLLNIALICALDLHGAGKRDTGGRSLHFIDDRLRAVAGYQRDLWSQTGELADGVQIKNKVFIERYTPALQNAGQSVVISRDRTPQLEGRIKHQQRAAATLNVLLDRVDFRLLVILRWTGGH